MIFQTICIYTNQLWLDAYHPRFGSPKVFPRGTTKPKPQNHNQTTNHFFPKPKNQKPNPPAFESFGFTASPTRPGSSTWRTLETPACCASAPMALRCRCWQGSEGSNSWTWTTWRWDWEEKRSESIKSFGALTCQSGSLQTTINLGNFEGAMAFFFEGNLSRAALALLAQTAAVRTLTNRWLSLMERASS